MDKDAQLNFSGKVVIVTGASSGIGAECATLFAKHGATLTLVGRDAKRLENVAKMCKDANAVVTPLTVNVNLTHSGSCESVVRTTVQTFGRIDVLVNCAGKLTVTSLFENTMEPFDETIAINLKVPYMLTQLALPHLSKTKGNVVNIVGGNMERVRPGFLTYSISMSGLENFTQSAALELASEGVRVNAVRPGITRTDFLRNFNVPDDEKEDIYSRLAVYMPRNQVIEPDEIAKMVVFVASETCPNLTGSCMNVDGAVSMS